MIPRPPSPEAIPKVMVYCEQRSTVFPVIFYGVARTEDGTVLSRHISSTIEWCHSDMTSLAKRKIYMAKYPQGYELVWITEPENHPWIRALCQPQDQYPELVGHGR